MDSLKVLLNSQKLFKEIEDSSGLGQAINYMLKHRHGLTQFFRYEGAPLDNNLCERAMKVAIRHRRNS